MQNFTRFYAFMQKLAVFFILFSTFVGFLIGTFLLTCAKNCKNIAKFDFSLKNCVLTAWGFCYNIEIIYNDYAMVLYQRTRGELMALLSGAQILIETLEEMGVENVFGYPGGSVLSVYDALPSSSIRHILTSHEQGACFAAEGYARASSKVGVVLTTSGPGATNLVTGIADAYMDSVPLVAITGNVSLDKLGHDAFQEVDIFDVTMPITKYGIIVKSASEIAPSIRKAFRIAQSGRKGPVLVDIPCNVFDELATYERQPIEKPVPTSIDASQIESALALIANSKKPFVYVGGGVKSSGATNEVDQLATKLNALVATSYMGIGCFNPDSPQFLGVLSNENPLTYQAIRECDLFVTLGARFNSRYSAFNTLKKRKIPLLQIDADKAEIDKNILTACAIEGDVKKVLGLILPRLDKHPAEPWECTKLQEGEKYLCRGEQIVRALSSKMNKNTIVTTDVGLHQVWTAHNYKFHSPDKFLTSGGLGAMGFSIGAGIGAHFATGCPILVITGDGSFNMNFNELLTAVKHHIPMVVAVMNNNSLGMIRKLQLERGNRQTPASSLYLNTDYVTLANAMGARGVRLGENDDINQKIDGALNGSLPVVIDCTLSINDGIN